MFSFFYKSVSGNSGFAYDYKFDSIDGGQIKLSDYKDKVIVIVNVASRCGYTPQYEDLQSLYDNYKDKNLVVIGVPTNNFKQEPGSNDEIKDFCETNFGISAIPKWNFHKIIIGKNGKVVDTFASFTKPTSKRFIKSIEKLI